MTNRGCNTSCFRAVLQRQKIQIQEKPKKCVLAKKRGSEGTNTRLGWKIDHCRKIHFDIFPRCFLLSQKLETKGFSSRKDLLYSEDLITQIMIIFHIILSFMDRWPGQKSRCLRHPWWRWRCRHARWVLQIFEWSANQNIIVFVIGTYWQVTHSELKVK